MRNFHLFICCVAAAILASCEAPYTPEPSETGNVTFTFTASGAQTRSWEAVPSGSPEGVTTRGTVVIGDYFAKLNVMLFNTDGTKYFDKVRTQYSTDENYGQMSLTLPAGEYTVVAVGHSSAKSATIKSPEMVQFTASEGQKLTDTFCYCGAVTIGDEPSSHEFTLCRVTAMLRFCFTDEEIPAAMTAIKFDYTGGSSNFNPTTAEGTTKSNQSEVRPLSANDTYQVYTFPYLSNTGALKVTVSALSADGTVLRKLTLTDVPVTRNRITTYTGALFSDDPGTITQSGFGFTADPEWAGEDTFYF